MKKSRYTVICDAYLHGTLIFYFGLTIDQRNTIINIDELLNELSQTPLSKFGSINNDLYRNNWVNGVSHRVRKSS